MTKPRFEVKEGGDAGEPCYIYESSMEVFIRLKPPADLKHAQAVRDYLAENIKAVEFDPDSMPPVGGMA
jgi:hypothetical protein